MPELSSTLPYLSVGAKSATPSGVTPKVLVVSKRLGKAPESINRPSVKTPQVGQPLVSLYTPSRHRRMSRLYSSASPRICTVAVLVFVTAVILPHVQIAPVGNGFQIKMSLSGTIDALFSRASYTRPL